MQDARQYAPATLRNRETILEMLLQIYFLAEGGEINNDKPKKRMAARSAAILFLGFDFVLTQSTVAIESKNRRSPISIFT